MLSEPDIVRPAFASHNVRSLAVAIETARELGLAQNAFELQMLHGMGDPIKAAVRGLGLRLREYAPVGELIPGMAYLVRRLLENTANDSFLRQTFVEGAAVERAHPAAGDLARLRRRRRDGCPWRTPTDPQAPGAFRNRPHADFSRRENREAYDAALAPSAAGPARTIRCASAAATSRRPQTLDSVNPAAPDEVVGTVAYGGRAEAEAAVAAARAAVAGVAGRHAGRARGRALPRRGADARRDDASSRRS